MAMKKKLDSDIKATENALEDTTTEVFVNEGTGTTASGINNPVVPPSLAKKDADTSGVTVDTSDPVLDESKLAPPKKEIVRIRMAVDHRCVIAMERYDFKKGQTYTVPANVKRVLNNAGLLAPL